ncbi:uncharacterized protein CTRU02_209931 [Colletotrichum truncatum]|uniref:Uncharacterized protein n=1 Tax=Colletotrichum truncatum TaxID=5467 RepID=A0ACC3YTX1_COLTU
MDSKATHAREQRLVEIRLLLQQLHQQLGPAYTFYCENLDGFETQVSQLKEYADKETLNKIWADKLRAEIKSNEAGTQDRSATKAVYINTITTQVSLCLRHLRTAYEERLPQACASHEQDVIIEAQINIVIGAVEKVLSLASVASTDHHASKNIVASLDRARSLSDTSSELWKALLIGLPATGSCTNESNREDGNQQTMEGGS